MTVDLQDYAKQKGIRHFMISFTDVQGVQRAKLTPAQVIGRVERTGVAFAGFATWLDMTAAHPDLIAMPDPAALMRLPWQPELAWMPATCRIEGRDLDHLPRNILRRMTAQAAAMGLEVRTGVEPEFFLLNPDGRAVSDAFDNREKSCYDQQALMRCYEVIGEITSYMQELGWGPYQCDHEDANGQFELNWGFAEALCTADRHSFFKFMLRSVAERHGLRSTFMPKPFAGLTGSGCHVHLSVWDRETGRNLFEEDGDPLGLSSVARHFLGGVMAHGAALAAICNPTVNSYKRINAPRTSSGSTWAPNSMTWAGNNRTHMVRVPGPGRFELRLPDGAANPYLLQAVIIAAGLDGLRRELDPGPPCDIDMYREGHKVTGAARLPRNLLDALREFERDEILTDALGQEFVTAYLKFKQGEWESYASHLTEWERLNTLDV